MSNRYMSKDITKTLLLINAIGSRQCKYFKIKRLGIKGYTHSELATVVPYMKSLGLIRHMFNSHCFTYERLFDRNSTEEIMENLITAG